MTSPLNSAPPVRRSFSLRTLLIVVTAAGILLGYQVNSAKQQQRAVQAIRDFGGWVAYDYELNAAGDYDPQAKSPVPGWLRERLGDDFFCRVAEVNLVYYEGRSARSDNANVSDDAMPHIGRLPHLRKLMLKDKQVNDESMAYIKRLTKLEKLYIWDGAEIGDYGVHQLENLPNLKYVHLSNARITDESLRVFGKMPSLEGLSLQGNRFTDRGLAHLRELHNLNSLWFGLGQTRITDEGLAHLHGLKKLETVEFQRSPVTDDGIDQLLAAIPNVKIVHDRMEIRQHLPARTAADPHKPQLNFLSTTHTKELDGDYWRTDGSLVEDKNELAALNHIRPQRTSGWPEGTGFLHLYIASEQFTGDTFGAVDLLYDDGEPIHQQLMHVRMNQQRSAIPAANLPGMQFFQAVIPPEVAMPSSGTVRLRYTAGPWNLETTFPADEQPGGLQVRGVSLLGIGDDAGGHAFVVIMVDEDYWRDFQYTIEALDAAGKKLRQQGQLTSNPGQGAAAVTVQFRAPLATVDKFQLLSRRKQTVDFPHTSYMPGVITQK